MKATPMRHVALIALLATPAIAEAPQAAMFPFDGHCYLRHYTKAHLAEHPDQLVREIAIGPYSGFAQAFEPALKVVVTLRGSSERFEGTAYCGNNANILSCQLEGDGGWFQLHPRPKGAVLLKVGRGGIGFEGNDFIQLSGTRGDDREFLLPHVPADSCP